MTTPDYDPPDSVVVDAALKAIDTLLDQCERDAADNTARGLLQYVHHRWASIRAERVIYGEWWAEEAAMLEYHGPDTHYSLTELDELMLELAHTEGLDLDTALDRAAEQLDELRYYVYDWDRSAVNGGNFTGETLLPF